VFPEHAEKQPACLGEAASAKAGGLAAGDLTGRVAGSRSAAPGSSASEQLRDRVAAEPQYQPLKDDTRPFVNTSSCSASSGNTAPSVFHPGRQQARTVPT
jgi:hypothetical protein